MLPSFFFILVYCKTISTPEIEILAFLTLKIHKNGEKVICLHLKQ